VHVCVHLEYVHGSKSEREENCEFKLLLPCDCHEKVGKRRKVVEPRPGLFAITHISVPSIHLHNAGTRAETVDCTRIA